MLKNQPIDVFIVAGIDLWPTLYPEMGTIVVTNLQHVQQVTTSSRMPFGSKWSAASLTEAVDNLRSKASGSHQPPTVACRSLKGVANRTAWAFSVSCPLAFLSQLS